MTYLMINLYCIGIRDFKSFGTTWLMVRSVLLGITALLLKNVMLSQLDASYIQLLVQQQFKTNYQQKYVLQLPHYLLLFI